MKQILLLLLSALLLGCSGSKPEVNEEAQFCQTEFEKPWQESAIYKAKMAIQKQQAQQVRELLEPRLYCYRGLYQLSVQPNAPKEQLQYRTARAQLFADALGLMMVAHAMERHDVPTKNFAQTQINLQEKEGILDINQLVVACTMLEEVHLAQSPLDREGMIQDLSRCYNLVEFVDLDHYRKEIRAWIPGMSYNIACSHSMLGHEEEALLWLERALKPYPQFAKLAEQDKDFDGIRKHPRYKKLIAEHINRKSDQPFTMKVTPSTTRK